MKNTVKKAIAFVLALVMILSLSACGSGAKPASTTANALYSPEQVVNMTAVANPNASYADLVSILSHMTMDDIKK